MIQANELRIGNLVQVANEYAKVTCVSADGISADSETASYVFETFDDISPIALAPEILERCGFKFGVHENGTYYIDLNTIDRQLDIILSGNEFYPNLIQAPEFSSEDCQIISLNKIAYLHELQNLYFILTGNELEIIEIKRINTPTNNC